METVVSYRDLQAEGIERSRCAYSNFYYRNQNLCDVAFVVGLALIVGVMLYARAN